MNIRKKFQSLIKFIKNKDARFSYLAFRGMYHDMSDDEYLKRMYKGLMQKELNLENPKTFNEKLQWLKLYDRKPEYTKMVDKYEAKKYVASVIGEDYIIPTLGVWDHFDDIDFDILPDQFVLKCTHDSGGLAIVRNKKDMNKKKIKKKIEKSLKHNFYYIAREWPYKNVKPRIIAEAYMENSSSGNNELTDYKLMCFNAKVKCSFTCTGRFSGEGVKVTFYDTDWKRMPFERHYPSEYHKIPKPESYDTMVKIAEKLAENIPFVRIDFYEIKGNPYFGEITLYPGAGFEEFFPSEWDEKLGNWIELPNMSSGGGTIK